ncbi:hypothetical protein B0T21DRAFT_428594 [Apiosordaria backusii]|uniref:Rhodopsin domain-containing protein n=1 Tax=Apiosordaria backusii TaxID=314023 RepID=A0AA40ERX3_9PEZI|nr:hypothetical protein B0T21DRAFT_428594 [Apiosordaria backusii]
MSSTNSTTTTYSPEYLAETRAPQALVAIILCPALALCFLVLRLYTRVFLLKKAFWEDYVIIMAMLSILLHYTRISVMACERRLCYGLITILMSGYIAVLIVSFVRCVPFYAIWTPGVPGARCIDTAAYFLAVQIHTLIMDFAILVVPLVILRHLSIPWPQRVLLVIVLGFGGMACIVAILRLQVLQLSASSLDRTWDSYFSAIYGVIESNVGIICACVVTLRPLIRKIKWLHSAGSPGGAEGEDSSSTRVVELPQQVRRPKPRRGDDIETGDDGDEDQLGKVEEKKKETQSRMGISTITESKRELVSTVRSLGMSRGKA